MKSPFRPASFIRAWLFAVVFVVGLTVGAGEASAGAQHNVTGWAWSGTIGWIAMNCTALGDCTSDFGVNIRNSMSGKGWGDISGYGWSETVGWVCFGVACPGPTPEGGAPYLQYRNNFEGQENQIYGWAKVLSMEDAGWISFNCNKNDDAYDTCATTQYFTSLDIDTGYFTKGLFDDHWGWSSTDEGFGIGWVNMGSVTTSWVPAQLGKILRPEGIFEPDNPDLPGTHLHTFNITPSGVYAIENQYIECVFQLPDGSSRSVGRAVPPGVTLHGENFPLPYTVQNADHIEQNRLWYITSCMISDAPYASSCVSDSGCGFGEICDESIGQCRIVMDEVNKKLPIFTHINEWTGLNSSEDQYMSIKCFAAFPNNYFRNAAQCDFTGDSSFSLTMRRGMPLEGDCHDGIDNDGNGQTDCDDRYCQGLSYFCNKLPRTTCVYGREDDNLLDCDDLSYVVGDLCCTQQPVAPGAEFSQVVNGMECEFGAVHDGYYDCTCDSAGYNVGDCFAPGPQLGDLCCDKDSNVVQVLP